MKEKTYKVDCCECGEEFEISQDEYYGEDAFYRCYSCWEMDD